MRRLRSALALAAALSLTAAAAPALGATHTTPATGTAQSSLQILDLRVAGKTVQAGGIAAVARNTPSRLAQLVVTPVAVDGAATGQQTVTSSSSPATVPSTAIPPVGVPGVLSVNGPTFDVSAKESATEVLTSAALKAIGSVSLTPAGLATLPINLSAVSMNNQAKVTALSSEAGKQLVIGDLSLPSINQLFNALGIDLNALLDQLTQGNLTKLGGLVDASLATLNSAVDSAQAALVAAHQSAPDTLAGATAALTPATDAVNTATSNLSAAQGALSAANSAWTTALTNALGLPVIGGVLSGAGITTSTTPDEYLALVAGNSALSVQSLVDAANAAVSAQTAETAAQTLLDTATQVLALVNDLVDALQNLVNGVANAVTSNGDPLAALGNITVQTKAVAAGTSPTPVAEANLGTLSVLGVSKSVSQLTSALNAATKTLTDVLTSVSGVAFTPPAISVGTGHTSTSKVGQTRKATASITGLTITLPSIALPAALSTVTNAITGGVGISNGTVSVLGGSVAVATMAESAAYTPATTTTSTPGTTTGSPNEPSLASTGLSRTIPVLAAVLIIVALAVLRRRRLAAHDL